MAEQIVRLRVRGAYSMARNAISDLGAVHPFGGGGMGGGYSPWHGWMNASFGLQGVLMVTAALLLRRRFARGAMLSIAFLLFGLSGVALGVVALIPEDTFGAWHVVSAGVHFICGGLAMLLVGAVLRRGRSGGLGWPSIGAGVLALAATLALGLGWGSALGWPGGAVERVAAYPLPLWLTGCGLGLLLQERRGGGSWLHLSR